VEAQKRADIIVYLKFIFGKILVGKSDLFWPKLKMPFSKFLIKKKAF
jgi:hypothetical protein